MIQSANDKTATVIRSNVSLRLHIRHHNPVIYSCGKLLHFLYSIYKLYPCFALFYISVNTLTDKEPDEPAGMKWEGEKIVG